MGLLWDCANFFVLDNQNDIFPRSVGKSFSVQTWTIGEHGYVPRLTCESPKLDFFLAQTTYAHRVFLQSYVKGIFILWLLESHTHRLVGNQESKHGLFFQYPQWATAASAALRRETRWVREAKVKCRNDWHTRSTDTQTDVMAQKHVHMWGYSCTGGWGTCTLVQLRSWY